jgi:four helix bundle suffix protein
VPRKHKIYIEANSPETAANTMICLVCQTTYLLDQVLRQLEQQFKEEGGFTERLHKVRTEARNNRS